MTAKDPRIFSFLEYARVCVSYFIERGEGIKPNPPEWQTLQHRLQPTIPPPAVYKVDHSLLAHPDKQLEQAI